MVSSRRHIVVNCFKWPIAALFAIALLLSTGCASNKPPLYHWGSYEQLIYEMYARPGEADPGAQVEKLSADVEREQAEDLRTPPGVHAHLGYMYYIQGNEPAAYNEFAIEREIFPESKVFVEGILQRLHAKGEDN